MEGYNYATYYKGGSMKKLMVLYLMLSMLLLGCDSKTSEKNPIFANGDMVATKVAGYEGQIINNKRVYDEEQDCYVVSVRIKPSSGIVRKYIDKHMSDVKYFYEYEIEKAE